MNRLDPHLVGTSFLIVADHLAPGEGQRVAFVEGREAANPYWPGRAAVDAYCSLIVDTFNIHPAKPGRIRLPVQWGRN